jgi:excisionase family DNA binding protein
MAKATSPALIVDDERPVLLRFKDVERQYKVPRSTLNDIISRGELSVVHLGRAVRVRREELETYLDSHTRRVR